MRATSVAARYSPAPNTAWLARLRRQFCRGAAVRDEAIPAPIAGCSTKDSAEGNPDLTVTISGEGCQVDGSNTGVMIDLTLQSQMRATQLTEQNEMLKVKAATVSSRSSSHQHSRVCASTWK